MILKKLSNDLLYCQLCRCLIWEYFETELYSICTTSGPDLNFVYLFLMLSNDCISRMIHRARATAENYTNHLISINQHQTSLNLNKTILLHTLFSQNDNKISFDMMFFLCTTKISLSSQFVKKVAEDKQLVTE